MTLKNPILKSQHLMKKNNEKKSMPIQLVKSLLNATHEQTHENANMNYSFASAFYRIAGETIKEYCLEELYPRKISDAHRSGAVHIHDLDMGIVGYCAGWSLMDLLMDGFNGVTGQTDSGPPKHFGTALGQMVNFLGVLQNNWAGAMAFNSVDTLLAPYIASDGLNYDEVEQEIQQHVHYMNITSRWGGQSPFTNYSLDLTPPKDLSLLPIMNGDTYADFQDEMDMFNLAFCNVMYKGDMKERPFTFPIPTYNLTKDFDWDSDVSNALFKMTAKYGIPYFQNFIGLDGDPSLVRSMCCRLRLDLTELLTREGGTFGYGDKTGCYDKETELLTNNGWKHFYALSKNDLIYTRTLDGDIELHKPLRYYEYDWNGELLKFKTKTLDLLVTPNHRMLVERKYKHSPGFVEAREFSPTNHSIPKYGKWIGKNVEYFILPSMSNEWVAGNYNSHHKKIWNEVKIPMDIWLPFFGIWLAEGSTDGENYASDHGYRVIISQIKKPERDKIRTMLNKTPFKYRETDKGFVICNKQLWSYLRQFGKCYDKHVPREIKNLPPTKLRVLLEWMVLGDGHLRDTGQLNYWTSSEKLANDLQEIAMKLGWASTKKIEKKKTSYIRGRKISSNDVWCISFRYRSKRTYLRNESKITKEHYNGKVYCVEVPNNTVYVRRNGITTWCGNSVGVVTINLPQAARLSGDEKSFLDRVGYLMELGKDSLEIKRVEVQKNFDNGLLPWTKRYLKNLKFHFSTIGLVGMNEACIELLGENIESELGICLAEKTLKYMKNKLVDFQKETGNLYNLEESPAEGASWRLAKMDKEKYHDIPVANPGVSDPFYTNSSHLPVDSDLNLIKLLTHQERLQQYYTGGTAVHVFIGERNPYPEGVKKLVRRIATHTKIKNFTMTPTTSICPNHGYLSGEHFTCPACGAECEVISRVTGYLRPVQQWNPGKQSEFKMRKTFE